MTFTEVVKKILQSETKSLSPQEIRVLIKDRYPQFYGTTSHKSNVANSKTLAHILPHFIPPIDRQYTIRFFTQEYKSFFTESGNYKPVNLPKDITAQFLDFKDYCCRTKILFDRCRNKIFTIDKESFNTSFPKIMDNLIMTFVKNVPKS